MVPAPDEFDASVLADGGVRVPALVSVPAPLKTYTHLINRDYAALGVGESAAALKVNVSIER